MKENFSKRVQTTMKYAKEEAIQLGHSYVGSEHLLLGILREGSGRAVDILEELGCDLEELRLMIEDMVKPAGGPRAPAVNETGGADSAEHIYRGFQP